MYLAQNLARPSNWRQTLFLNFGFLEITYRRQVFDQAYAVDCLDHILSQVDPTLYAMQALGVEKEGRDKKARTASGKPQDREFLGYGSAAQTLSKS